ncbi:hypothetical protein [Actinoplanes couchii]|uniref:Uncharacterized protein n=1 Tax=Actinoplanes couchii TaxID=403638 RepID=A0ABQ3XMK7_9ACTN|nr:hypothetical protein [Actinoplanes couchii]MDR6321651.1 hypothetical protein [Actinoplanes couchii]GID59747.1 hypothetical protein Aco03nite_081510 [Actinoplanes couchii]
MGSSVIKWIRNYLNRRLDPAPNPLRLTVHAVDRELAALRRRGESARIDLLLDVRTVLARHEETDQIRPSATRRSSFAYPSLTPTSMPL